MAVKELVDYLRTAISKTRQLSELRHGRVPDGQPRGGVAHMNIPNMIGQITGILAEQGVNISDMTNKSRDKYAWLDLETVLETGKCWKPINACSVCAVKSTPGRAC